jgi:hypothetical protein
VRSGSRDDVGLLRDLFLTAHIPISMQDHAGRCRAETLQASSDRPNRFAPGFLHRRLGSGRTCNPMIYGFV